MKKLYTIFACLLAATTLSVTAQQLPDPHFEDWSDSFNGDAQPKYWHGSNVEQVGFKFTFLYQKDGRSGKCAYVADKEVGAMGITEVGPGYFGLGTAWSYLEGLSTGTATAGTYGGINFTYRPDTMSVWIKRTGSNTDKEDFHLLFYSWTGTAKGSKYKNKNGGCTSVSQTNEESDIRQALDGNECGTDTKPTQIAEGWYRARAEYNNWVNIKVPIYYMGSDAPSMCNVIFSAGNYPNFRANSGLYKDNGLWVDDVELIYSSEIQSLVIDGKEWKGFDPTSSEEQTYSLGEKATTLPTIEAWRGAGTLKNVAGTSANFPGRKLSGSEITITNGVIDGTPTTITVKAGDGSSTHTYKIKFVRAASTNANLAGININGEAMTGFKATTTTYNVELPFGTTKAPVVEPIPAEDAQTVTCTQPSSVNGKATITVTAADKKTTKTYTLNFSVAQLKDNTLKSILVNGSEIAGFVPTQTIYKVSLPLGTTTMPTVEAVSAYPAGAQTITYTAPDKIDGGTYQISVTTPGNQTPKTYKLNFKLEASTYSKLKSLQMGGYITDFTPDNLTYYVNLPIGTTALPEITYEKGDAYQKDVEIQNGGLDGTTRVIVTAASGDQTVYKIIVSTEKSSNSSLQNIFIAGKALVGFAPNTLKYTYDLEVGTTTIPTITFTQGDEYQTVTINYGGLNETTRVTVTAGDGSTTSYQIVFAVQKSTNCSLKDLKVGGTTIEGFDPTVLEYYYTLAKGAAIPAVTAVKAETSQTVNERKVTSAPGDYKLTVVAESGAKQTYIIHFVLNLSKNADLAAILLDGEPMKGFNATTYNYVDSLPIGQSMVPEVSFTRGDNGQKVIVSENNNTYTLKVTAEDGKTVHTYTVLFVIQVSNNAFLDMIYVDGQKLPNFKSDSLTYEYELTGSTIPAITYDKADEGQQVTVAAPVGPGVASLLVAAEAGGANTYTINFKRPSTNAVLLSQILVNDTLISGWNAQKENYTVTYKDTIPTVKAVGDPNYQQTISQIDSREKDEEGKEFYQSTIIVEAAGDSKTYTVILTHKPSSNALLDEVALNNVAIENWVEGTKSFSYSRKLQTGEEEPVITYKKHEENQKVIFGQKGQGKYQLVVLAADDTTAVTYNITFEPADLYTETALEKIMLDGVDITNLFDANDTYDGGEVPEGTKLPTITYDKNKGQSVVLGDVSANQQQIIVVAENGDSRTYTINYTVTVGNDVRLSGILLDGDKLKGFDPDTKTYSVELPERTEAVPAITPLSDVVGQTYTITYGRVNARTTIEVLAKDGQTKGYYYIDFNVKPLTSTQLSKLELSTGEVLMTDPTVVEYTHELPFNDENGIPTVSFVKGENEQKIEYTRGRGGETWIKVIAQSGDNRTYHVQFTTAQPTDANVLKAIKVNHESIALADEMTVNLPFGTTEFDVEYTKNYEAQAVIVNNGGVNKPTQIIVMANHPDVPDKVYTIKPEIEKFDKAKTLKSLTFNGQSVPNFKPDVYNYVVNVTSKPNASNFKGVTFDNVEVTTTDIDHAKKQIVLEVSGGEKYSVCWFYETDNTYVKNGKRYSYLDFSADWVATPQVAMWTSSWTSDAHATTTTKSTGFKPSDKWTVPADIVAGLEYEITIGKPIVDLFWYTGKEVIAAGVNGAMLSTMNGASINGSVPGMMTIGGTLTLKPGKKGNSTSSITYSENNYIQMRNTPDSLSMRYKSLNANRVTSWYYELKTKPASASEMKFSGNYNSAEWRYASLPITTTGERVSYALTINSAHTDNAGSMTGNDNIYSSDLQVEDIHFVYNSDIKNLWVDEKTDTHKATISGTNITFTIDDAEYNQFPQIILEGQVHDQEQSFTWADEVLEGEYMVRRALLRNYGEDHSYTDYNLEIKRAAVDDTTLSSIMWGDKEILAGAKKDYVVYRNSPLDKLPDIVIERNSVHQNVNVTRNGDVISIVVTAETGKSMTYTITVADYTDNDATLAGVILPEQTSLDKAFAADVNNYVFSGAEMPVFDFTKRNQYQSVHYILTTDSAKMIVTAADKATTNTYSFLPTVAATTGELATLNVNGKGYNNPAARIEIQAQPEQVLFARKQAADSVSEIIVADSVVIRVYSSAQAEHIYKVVNTAIAADDDAKLKGILVNNEDYDQFDPTENSLIIPTDTMVSLQFVAANAQQQITMSLKPTPRLSAKPRKATSLTQSFTFEVVVTAADGQTTNTYSFILETPKSADATLQAVIVGNDTIVPNNLYLTYTLPIAAGPKTKQPIMPDIKYIPTDPQATVEITPAGLNGTNFINVTPADGSQGNEYQLEVLAGKSAYAQLNGILVDGAPIPDFAPDRYFYSVQVEHGKHTVVASSEDRYVSIDTTYVGGKLMINVLAEDGVHSERYIVDLYEESKSANAKLADILFIYKDKQGNDSIVQLPGFDPNNNKYEFPLTFNETEPDVRGIMAVNGQEVTVNKSKATGSTIVAISVVAPDKVEKNKYTINFTRELSDDITLKMIMLDGDSLQGFTPEKKIYQATLPVGIHELPTIYAQRAIKVQKMPEIVPVEDRKVEIRVTAENGAQGVYTLLFQDTYSAADSLLAVYADNQILPNFEPRNFFYDLMLPVEAVGFPELTWEEADEFQTIKLDTLRADSLSIMYQIQVTAENDLSNRYLISYQRELWDVDTLQMIYVDNKPLEGFKANLYEYNVILAAGTTELPTVSYDTNDKFKQRISVVESVDSIATKSLNKKVTVTVEAENGKYRTYTIHFPVELSSEASLNLIQYGDQTIAGFDSERTDYKVELPLGTVDIPVITVGKKEEAQKVDISTKGWFVTIDVLAEDGIATKQYTIDFVMAKSTNAAIDSLLFIYDDHIDSLAIEPDVFEYRVVLPVGQVLLPQVDAVKADSLQTVEVLPMTQAADGTFITTVITTAADEETQLEYLVIFEFGRSNNADLKMIYIDGEELEGFHVDSLTYHVEFPAGSTTKDFYTTKRITYTKADQLATDTMYIDANYTILIDVTAQDGTRNTYSITQSIGLSDDNTVLDILLDSVSYREFDPDVYFYTYYIAAGGTAPQVDAIAGHEKAEISVTKGQVGDTIQVICTAENGDTRIYSIWFRYTTIDDAQTPESQDVLVKRLFGSTQILVASLRSGVQFYLYDRNGHIAEFVQQLPVCDQNDAIVTVNANGQETLIDVVDPKSGVVLTLAPNTIYFYGFYETEGRRISSGKLIIVNGQGVAQ